MGVVAETDYTLPERAPRSLYAEGIVHVLSMDHLGLIGSDADSVWAASEAAVDRRGMKISFFALVLT